LTLKVSLDSHTETIEKKVKGSQKLSEITEKISKLEIFLKKIQTDSSIANKIKSSPI
jgi:hypothetical protein